MQRVAGSANLAVYLVTTAKRCMVKGRKVSLVAPWKMRRMDNVFFVLGKGLLATLLTVAASILRLVLGRDASRGSDASTARIAAAAAARAAAASSKPPRRVLEASNGDPKKLRDKHLAWLSWRREYDVDAIFTTPKPAYACVKCGFRTWRDWCPACGRPTI